MLTGKTISELNYSASTDPNLSIPFELSGQTFHLKYGDIQPSKVFRAQLFQTGSIVSTVPPVGGLIVGETYTITNYVAGDDFTNIADVQSGTINTTGCVFIATQTGLNDPTVIWSNGSELTSLGDFIMNVLENTLGFDVLVDVNPGAGDGIFVFYSDTVDPMFDPNKTFASIQNTPSIDFNVILPFFLIFNEPANSTVTLFTSDLNVGLTNNVLYYTPLTINLY